MKYRYLFAQVSPPGMDAMCQRLEDEGYEVISAIMQIIPASGGAAGLGMISARIDRKVPKTPSEVEMEKAAESRIIQFPGNGRMP